MQGDAPSAGASEPRGNGHKGTKLEQAYRTFSIASVGLEMGVAVLIGFGIGYYLDKWAGTEPYLMLVFLGVGIAAAFKAFFRAARQAKSISGESQ